MILKKLIIEITFYQNSLKKIVNNIKKLKNRKKMNQMIYKTYKRCMKKIEKIIVTKKIIVNIKC